MALLKVVEPLSVRVPVESPLTVKVSAGGGQGSGDVHHAVVRVEVDVCAAVGEDQVAGGIDGAAAGKLGLAAVEVHILDAEHRRGGVQWRMHQPPADPEVLNVRSPVAGPVPVALR